MSEVSKSSNGQTTPRESKSPNEWEFVQIMSDTVQSERSDESTSTLSEVLNLEGGVHAVSLYRLAGHFSPAVNSLAPSSPPGNTKNFWISPIFFYFQRPDFSAWLRKYTLPQYETNN